jgi:enoyl-[acyl-carrier protein] reductase II
VWAGGILIGTVFLVTQESPIHDKYKNALIRATDTDTVLLIFPSFSVRFWKNKRAIELKDDFIDDEVLWKLVSEPSDVTDIQGSFWVLDRSPGLLKHVLQSEKLLRRWLSVSRWESEDFKP